MQFDGLQPTINTFQNFISISFEFANIILKAMFNWVFKSNPNALVQKTRHEANTMTQFLEKKIELRKCAAIADQPAMKSNF